MFQLESVGNPTEIELLPINLVGRKRLKKIKLLESVTEHDHSRAS